MLADGTRLTFENLTIRNDSIDGVVGLPDVRTIEVRSVSVREDAGLVSTGEPYHDRRCTLIIACWTPEHDSRC